MYSSYHEAKKAEAAAKFTAMATENGAILLLPDNFTSKTKVPFTCKCGASHSTSLDYVRKSGWVMCKKCSALAMRTAPSTLAIKEKTLSWARNKAESGGASNLAIDYDKPTPQQVSFTCLCGSDHSTSIEAFRSDQVLPHCPACSRVYRSQKASQAEWVKNSLANSLQRLVDNASTAGTSILPETFQGVGKHVTYLCVHCKQPKQTIAAPLLKPGNRFLCLDCQTGEMSSKWNPDLTKEHRANGRLRYAWWPRQVLEAHDFTCAISGVRGQELAAHHLYNYGHHPHHRHLVCNGVALLRELHDEFHSIYGRGNNTLGQFQAFYFSKTGREYSNAELSRSLIVRPINPYEVAS